MHKPSGQAALGFIFVTLLVDVMGFGIIIPVLPQLIAHLIHGTTNEAAPYAGWLAFAYASMQFFFSPVIGNLSDKYGRRPVLLSSLLGFGIDYLFLAFAPTVWWLFVGRMRTDSVAAEHLMTSSESCATTRSEVMAALL